jgi:hypothetical protein
VQKKENASNHTTVPVIKNVQIKINHHFFAIEMTEISNNTPIITVSEEHLKHVSDTNWKEIWAIKPCM